MTRIQRVMLFRGLLVAVALSAGLEGCSSERTTTVTPPQTIHNVSVLAAQKASVPDVLEAVGTVRAAQTTVLASQMMGNIVEIRAHEGDRVKRGQVLAVIDDSQARASVERATAAQGAAQQQVIAAESELSLADSTLKRYQTLYERKSVSPQEFDEINTRRQGALAQRDMARAGQVQATAALSQSRTSQEYSRIRAPFDGVVTEKKADTGTLASAGMAIFTVEDVRRYRLEATVNENDLRFVRLGEVVPVVVDALGNTEVSGKVVEIVPAADAGSRSFQVKIELPTNPQLRSGLFARAQFSRGKRMSLLIPQTAMVQRGQLVGVYVLDESKIANLRYVTLGALVGAQVEVLAGIQDGDRLVAAPGVVEFGGKRVEAQ